MTCQYFPEVQRFWTDDELLRILAGCDQSIGYFDNFIRRDKFMRALMCVINETGLPRMTLCRLQRDWLRDDGRLVVPNRGSFQLTWATIVALSETYPPKRELLLPWQTNGRRGFYNALERVFKRAGIPSERRFAWNERRAEQCA